MNSKMLIVIFIAAIHALVLDKLKTLDDADNSLFIYGAVTTIDDEVYEGQIRWGKEEAFWFDFFNSTKPANEFLKYLNDDQLEALNENDGNQESWISGMWNNWSDDHNKQHTHSFSCRFGDIKSIQIGGDDDLTLILKNGDEIELEGGSNDIGTTLRVFDNELGQIEIDWERIDRVDFREFPAEAKAAFGLPLYGTVRTEHGQFTGYVQWDHDERLSLDKLDGNYEDGKLSVEFGKIKSIKKYGSGSMVTLHSDRTFELTGSNDVNRENRGIIVNIEGMGRVDIPWDEFLEVSFADIKGRDSHAYNMFNNAVEITAIVETVDGEKFNGPVAFDLDEKYRLEMLDGVYKDIEYFIPFELIRSIEPDNREESKVTLANGEVLMLRGKVDVDERNDGILMLNGIKEQEYIPWARVKRVSFL